VQKGKIKQDDPMLVPDVYSQNNELERQTFALKEEMAQWQALTGYSPFPLPSLSIPSLLSPTHRFAENYGRQLES
jgi:hypothetical protein